MEGNELEQLALIEKAMQTGGCEDVGWAADVGWKRGGFFRLHREAGNELFSTELAGSSG